MSSGLNERRPLAAILGCSGPALTAEERSFFQKANPYGFILFRRNCKTPDQLRRLVDDLRGAVGRADAPVLIDQEGGRVQRLRAPHWAEHPAAGRFSALAERDPDLAERAVELNARSIAIMLREHGITMNAAPVLDLRLPGASDVVGDRSFGQDPELVARLGRAAARGYLSMGIIPVVKHMPGHGRATVDSHLALPVVTADRETLALTDFRPFRALADLPWAMTGHIVFQAIDPDRPATLSATVIGEVIRGEIGFDGVIVSDDLSMGALEGPIGRRAADAVAAGCDLALHCNGVLAEMEAVAGSVPPIGDATHSRLKRHPPAEYRPWSVAEAEEIRAELARALAVG